MTDAPDHAPARRLLARTAAATVAGVLPAFLIGAVAVQAGADLGFDPAGLGLAVGMFFLAGSATSALLGRVVERLGAGRSLRLFDLGSAVVLLLIAVVPDYHLLLLLLAGGGVMNAAIQPAANLAIVRAVRPSRQGLAFAVKQAAMPTASLLGGLAVPVFALSVGWRWAFAAAAVLAAAAAVTAPLEVDALARPVPRAKGNVRAGDVSLRPLLALAVGVGLGAASAGAVVSFAVKGGVDAGLPEALAGFVLTGGSVLGVTMRLVVGSRADKRGGRHLPVVAAMTAGGAVGVVLMATGTPWLFVVGTAVTFGVGWGWPGLFNFAVVRHNRNAPAAATGITQTGTNIGAVLGPLLFGVLVDTIGWTTAWLAAGGCFLAASAAMLVGRRMLRADLGRGAAPTGREGSGEERPVP